METGLPLGIDISADETTLLQAIFWSAGASRLTLANRLDFSKSKTNSLVAALLDVGLLEETGLKASSGGRRPETVQISPSLGVLIAADLGATSLNIAILRPDLSVLVRILEAADVRAGPGVVMARVRVLMRQLLTTCGTTAQQVLGIGMGVPGPVDFTGGQLVQQHIDKI